MATYATLTVPVVDIIGADFNASRASVWIEPNVPVVLADSIRVGGRREQVVNGVATFTNLATTDSADNPANFGYRVTITAPPKGAQKREDIVVLTTADFPFTATANLKDIDEAWDHFTAPPEWRSDFRAEMEAIRDGAAAIAGPVDSTVEALVKNTGGVGPMTSAALSAAIGTAPATNRAPVLGRRDLARYEAARATGLAHIVVVGNSISWGVGSNDDPATTTGYVADYRQYAWPVQLRRMLARETGALPTEGWIGLTADWGYATLGGTAQQSQTTGPFGTMSASGRGGVLLKDTTATVTIPATKTGKFTELDVFYLGTGAGVGGGKPPTIKIDGATVYTGSNVSNAGNICVQTVTGLTDATHEIVLTNPGGSGSTDSIHVFGVLPRRSSGVTVSRIAVPGATMREVNGNTGWTAQQKQRQIDTAVLKDYSDLVIISLTANEVYQQRPLVEYQTTIQALVDSAVAGGACVLLMGDPAVFDEEKGATYPIKGSDYRGVLKTIATASAHVAYADFQDAVFGPRDRAWGLGLFPSGNGTVHPMNEGHRRMADFLYRDVLPGPALA